MKFNIGDRVSFLDENLEGVISAVLGEGMVRVRVDDGFEFDMNEKQLVLLNKPLAPGIPASPIVTAAKSLIDEKNIDPFIKLEGDSFYFAACPGEEMQVLTGPVGFYLVNKLPFDVAFSFTARIGNFWKNLAHGELPANANRLLCSVRRNELIDWSAVNLQAIFYKKGMYGLLPPLNKDLPLQWPGLSEANDGLEGFWAYSKITRLTTASMPLPDLDMLKEKYTPPKPAVTQPAREAKKTARPSEEAVLVNESEVDLHIQLLADDYQSLDNAQMLQIQMQRFRREMDQAVKHHYKKITFIHGVGNGVLRKEILRELRSYSGIAWHDAPFEKYGFGATQVVFL